VTSHLSYFDCILVFDLLLLATIPDLTSGFHRDLRQSSLITSTLKALQSFCKTWVEQALGEINISLHSLQENSPIEVGLSEEESIEEDTGACGPMFEVLVADVESVFEGTEDVGGAAEDVTGVAVAFFQKDVEMFWSAHVDASKSLNTRVLKWN
jgi:hypothetical protein